MAQYTVSLDPSVAAASPGGACTLRLETSVRGQYVTFVVKDGETIRTDDPVTAKALDTLLAGRTKCVTTLAARPANPTHDVDTKPRAPLPLSADGAEAKVR
jgi:hypothetical protein